MAKEFFLTVCKSFLTHIIFEIIKLKDIYAKEWHEIKKMYVIYFNEFYIMQY